MIYFDNLFHLGLFLAFFAYAKSGGAFLLIWLETGNKVHKWAWPGGGGQLTVTLTALHPDCEWQMGGMPPG